MTENKKHKKSYSIIDNTSFICTVYNEEKSMPHFLRSFFEQEALPGEIIIVDGGSDDGTVDVINNFFSNTLPDFFGINSKEYPGSIKDTSSALFSSGFLLQLPEDFKKAPKSEIEFKLFIKNNAGISEGRNTAIQQASNEIICVSDAGCVLDKKWMHEITKCYFESDNIYVCGGYSQAVAITFLEKLLSICIMPELKEIKPQKFMPSSRNLSFKKIVWDKTGGYPQDLDFGEDMKLNFNIKNAGYHIEFNPEAVVYWRMRESLPLIFKQFFRYAKGDAKGGMYLHRHLIRLFSLLLFILILAAALAVSPWIFIAFLPALILYIFKPMMRINSAFIHIKNKFKKILLKTISFIFLPYMLAYIDAAKTAGYFYGLVKK